MYFFTSDTHFGHERAIELCNRPFRNAQEMNDTIIKNWNERVGKDDIVFHLGDFAMHPRSAIPDLVKALNGQIVLVAGNHDYKKSLLGFADIVFGPLALTKAEITSNDPDIVNRIIHLVKKDTMQPRCNYTEDSVGSLSEQFFVLSHEPVDVSARELLLLDEGECPKVVNLCGHVHGDWNVLDRMDWKHYDVGVDVQGYKPVTLVEVMDVVPFIKPVAQQHRPIAN